MRNQFAKTITELAKDDERIVLLSGDIGNRLFNDYKALAANRFYNCGIAEANMTGVAAGLAARGLRPITYTITPFNTIRCLEQIKIDVAYHKLPVIIVGTGSGLSYANLGPTHQSCDDIALLRTIPNMTVLAPADIVELKILLKLAIELSSPVYIRIGKKNEPIIHKNNPDLEIGKGFEICSGKDTCILSTGNTLELAISASELLSSKNISTSVYSFHTVKPLDFILLKKLTKQYSQILTIEEHGLIGGFGSAIAEWFIDNNIKNCELSRIGLPDKFIHESAGQKQARLNLSLTADSISNFISNKLSING